MELKVKEQKLATRCEICHQSDQFDPVSELCKRCSGVLVDNDAEIILRIVPVEIMPEKESSIRVFTGILFEEAGNPIAGLFLGSSIIWIAISVYRHGPWSFSYGSLLAIIAFMVVIARSIKEMLKCKTERK